MKKALALLLGIAAVIGVAVAAMSVLRTPRPPPNVIVILWDTVRADRLSMYGYELPTTPRMAAWAESNGVIYEQAVSPAMWTVPSHASLFTGLAPSTHGAGYDHRWLDNHNVTLAEHFGASGYDTYAFSANPNLSPSRVNLLQGFEHRDLSWSRKWRKKVVEHTRTKLMRRDRSTEISPANKQKQQTVGFYNAGPVTHEALTTWLDSRTEPDKPFFAYLSYMEAHKPRVPFVDSRTAVTDRETVQLGLQTDLTFKSQLLYSYDRKAYTPEELEAVNRVYDATLIDLDNATADLLDDLQARGVLDNTIVVFTSDHGEQLGEHQQFGHRSGVYQQLLHVPLIIAYPGTLSPQRVATPVSNLDVYNTLLELAGLDKPDSAFSRGNLADIGKLVEQAVFAESISIDRLGFGKVKKLFPDLTRDVWATKFRAVRMGEWKLIASIDFDTDELVRHELYHVAEDPFEAREVSEQHPDEAARLSAALQTWRESLPLWDQVSADEDNSETTPEMKKQLALLGYTEEEEEDEDEVAEDTGAAPEPEQ